VRPGGLRNQLDGRQLKICSTCFDITVGLLRVIEMIVCLHPQAFVAGNTQHSELLLQRLLQAGCFLVFVCVETYCSLFVTRFLAEGCGCVYAVLLVL